MLSIAFFLRKIFSLICYHKTTQS